MKLTRRQHIGVDQSVTISPEHDVFISEGQLEARIELPHFKPDEVSVTAYNSGLDIKADHEERREQHNATGDLFSQESQTYWRRIPVPHGADFDRLRTAFRNGVLSIHLPLHHTMPHKK